MGSSYPEIILPNATISTLDKVSLLGTFVEEFALLSNVWVDPNANLVTRG
jgi:hypothetical protein